MGSPDSASAVPPTPITNSPDASAAGGASDDQRFFLPGCGVVLLVIGSCVGLFVAPQGWKFPAAVGALAAAGTLLAAGLASRWPSRLLALVFGASLTTAATLLWRAEFRTVGLVAAAVVLVLLPAALIQLAQSDSRESTPVPKRTWFTALVGGVVLAGVAGAIIFAVPGQWRWSAVAGTVAGVIGLGATARAPRWWQRPVVLLLFSVPLTAAAVLLWRQDLRAFGVVAAAIMLFGLPPTALMVYWQSEAPERRTWRHVLFRLSLGMAIAVLALSVLGFIKRGQGSFAVAYGKEVTVRLGDECQKTIVFRGNSDEIQCDEAQWEVGGRPYAGTVYLDDAELGIRYTATSVRAFVIPGSDEAYSPEHYTSKLDGMELFGQVPWWTGLPFLALSVLFGAVGNARPTGAGQGHPATSSG